MAGVTFFCGARMVPVAKREVAVVMTLPMFERIFAQIRRACQPHRSHDQRLPSVLRSLADAGAQEQEQEQEQEEQEQE